MVTLGPEANGWIREVACFKAALNVWYLRPEPNGRDKEMAALHSDHYTQVQLYTYMYIVHVNTHTLHNRIPFALSQQLLSFQSVLVSGRWRGGLLRTDVHGCCRQREVDSGCYLQDQIEFCPTQQG